jgi:hypothetical protein
LRLLKTQDRRFSGGIAGAEHEERWRRTALGDGNQIEKALNFRDVSG